MNVFEHVEVLIQSSRSLGYSACRCDCSNGKSLFFVNYVASDDTPERLAMEVMTVEELNRDQSFEDMSLLGDPAKIMARLTTAQTISYEGGRTVQLCENHVLVVRRREPLPNQSPARVYGESSPRKRKPTRPVGSKLCPDNWV